MRPEDIEELKLTETVKTFSNLLWKEVLPVIQSHFEAGFQGIFRGVLERKELPTRYFPEVKARLPGWLGQLDFSQLVDDYHI